MSWFELTSDSGCDKIKSGDFTRSGSFFFGSRSHASDKSLRRNSVEGCRYRSSCKHSAGGNVVSNYKLTKRFSFF